MSNGGKGSARRPTNMKSYEDNWDRIFGRKVVQSFPVQESVTDTTLGNQETKEVDDGRSK